jgi:hypothetical protein
MMKQLFLTIPLALLWGIMTCAKVLPYFSIRSQSENAARELVLWQTQINLYDKDSVYGSFSITPEYTKTIKSAELAQALFADILSTDCDDNECPQFKVQGSLVVLTVMDAILVPFSPIILVCQRIMKAL